MPRYTEYRMRCRSTDMDADGVVNNARYFEFFEQARLEHLAALEVVRRPRPAGEPARSFTLAETTCRYRAPLRHRDEIIVRAWTEEVRTRSFILAYDIHIAGTDTLIAEGTSAQVWLDADARPTALPASVRDALERSQQGAGPASNGDRGGQ